MNYFASKMIFLNILQNVTIILFEYFVLHITIIHRNDTFLNHTTNQISLSFVPIMGYPGITWDNFLTFFLCTFPSEIIWRLKIFNIKRLLKKEEGQLTWKGYFFTFDKDQKAWKTQLTEKLWLLAPFFVKSSALPEAVIWKCT